mmetsp:Transcript_6160/g.25832  ORF Transcript_6160/g.25832 Transcript_6160/m.25832 type:complete len:216 (+) Transcript_6160:1629-2276(+)
MNTASSAVVLTVGASCGGGSSLSGGGASSLTGTLEAGVVVVGVPPPGCPGGLFRRHSSRRRCKASSTAASVSNASSGSVTKSNNERSGMGSSRSSVRPYSPKKTVTFLQSDLRNSSARGWSCSTACETSMTTTSPRRHSRLYSERSAWTSFARAYMTRIARQTCQYAARSCGPLSSASLSRGAGQPSSPTNSMTSTLAFTRNGRGARTAAASRRR